jgi:hypothetical protein
MRVRGGKLCVANGVTGGLLRLLRAQSMPAVIAQKIFQRVIRSLCTLPCGNFRTSNDITLSDLHEFLQYERVLGVSRNQERV